MGHNLKTFLELIGYYQNLDTKKPPEWFQAGKNWKQRYKAMFNKPIFKAGC
jgi:hypothetical protein